MILIPIPNAAFFLFKKKKKKSSIWYWYLKKKKQEKRVCKIYNSCPWHGCHGREKVLENEKISRSGKSQGITFSVREI